MSDSVERDMDPTPRRRRNSKDFDLPDLSGDSSREQDDEETERREEQERLRREEEERRRKEEERLMRKEEEEKLRRKEEERLMRKEEEERLRRKEEERLMRKEEEERLRRKEEERLMRKEEEERQRSALVLKEEMKIQEFVQQSPDQLKEIESAVRELNKIADDIHNDRDALGGGTPAFLDIQPGVRFAAAGALIAVVGAVLFLFTEGGVVVFVTGAVLFIVSAAIAGSAVSALRAYNKKIEEICENASSRIAELSRSATTAIAAVLNLKRLSGSPDTAADSDYEKVFEMLKRDSGLRDLTERMEPYGTVILADSPIDQMAKTIFPKNLEEFYSWFGIFVSCNIREQKNKKVCKIDECAVKLEENLEVVREIHEAITTRLKEQAQSCK